MISQRIDLTRSWDFWLSEDRTLPGFPDESSRKVNLPHDWSVEGEYLKDAPTGADGAFLPSGSAWYMKSFSLPFGKGKVAILEMPGFFNEATVYINGHHAAHDVYGFFGLRTDISGYLIDGINTIQVFIDSSAQPASRWYNGAGIIRPVWIDLIGEYHIDHHEAVLSSDMLDGKGRLEFTIPVVGAGKDLDVQLDASTEKGKVSRKVPVVDGKAIGVIDKMTAIPWCPENPRLYEVDVRLLEGNEVLDEYSYTVGYRHLEFIPDEGFFLNGKMTKLKGECFHYDYGIVGMAVTRGMMKRRLECFRDMGANAVRFGHMAFGEEMLELCDRYGMMVLSECFDGWDVPKARMDYGIHFRNNWRRHLEKFVKEGRNHPSVIMWGIGNEVVGGTEERELQLIELVRSLDSTRPITCGVQGTGEYSDMLRRNLDIAGYNDGGGACFIYGRDHERRPEQLMVATESPHTLQTRGMYKSLTWWRDRNTPRKEVENLTEEEVFLDGGPCYHSSFDNAGVRLNARDCWRMTEKTPYLIGEFRWSGPDYYGEGLEWPARGLGYGIVDTAGYPKDHWYLYKAMWSSEPVTHILPGWTYRNMKELQELPVLVYTNGDEVELFLNGRSIGRKNPDYHVASFLVPWTPGDLKAVSYRDGMAESEDLLRTAGLPLSFRLAEYKPEEGEDIHEYRIEITDGSGIDCPDDHQRFGVFVDDGRYVGAENGDNMDLTPLTSNARDVFRGKALFMVEGENPSFTVFALEGLEYFHTSTFIRAELKKVGNPEDTVLSWKIGDGDEVPCEGSLEIFDTTEVEVFLRNASGKLLLSLSRIFMKGEPPIYLDKAHGNREILSEVPVGPFSRKIVGKWMKGDELLDFRADGTLYAVSVAGESRLGSWWYDFPVDFFEAQDYAGTGEIWFKSGEKQKIALTSQYGGDLVIDNASGGFSTAYDHPEIITLVKGEEE